MQWKDFFEERILERGYDYYRSGNVEDLNIQKNEITATVYGSEEYDVSILMDGREIEEMECTCPYAEDGNYCKHMAAVLYAAEKEPAVISSSVSEIETFVEQADIGELKKFLIEVLQKDDALFLKLKSSLAKKSEEIDIKQYQKQIERTIREYGGHYGYIEYDDAGSFMDEMEEYLDNDVQKLISTNLLESAFELSSLLFLEVSAVEMDDSNGELGAFGCHCCEVWKKIISLADKTLKEKIFLWLISHLDGSVVDYMEEYLEDMVMQEFQNLEYLQKKLSYTEQRSASIPLSDNWSRQYERKKWALYHITIMEQLHLSDDEILAYCHKYWEHSDIRKYCVNYWVSHGNDTKAISILEESLKLDEKSPGLIADYYRQLKELYKKQGNQKLYREYLYQLVTDSTKLEDFRELKSDCSNEEWLALREKIFSEISPHEAAVFYQEEGLHDRLLKYVMSQQEIYELKKYEKILAKHYPVQVLTKYHDFLMKSAQNVADRKTYQEWANILKRMTKIKDGSEYVEKIIAEWHQLYPRRKAMMQEIDKIKL